MKIIGTWNDEDATLYKKFSLIERDINRLDIKIRKIYTMKKYNHKSIFQNVVFSMLVFLCGFKDCLGILDQVNHGMPNIDMTVNDLTNIKSDHDRDLISSSSSAATRNLVLVDDAPRQTDVWEMINTMDSYKLPPSYTQRLVYLYYISINKYFIYFH